MTSSKLLSLSLFAFFLSALGQSANFNYNGGIPMRTPDECPAGSVSGQVTYEQNCCGSGQTFEKGTNGSFCCPNENDCSAEVIAAPKCADPSWQLCGSDSSTGFCCQENWICFTQLPFSGNGGGVGCSTPGATLGLSQSQVLTIFAANAGPGATTTTTTTPVATSSVSPASATVTPSSTTSLVASSTSSTTSVTASSVAQTESGVSSSTASSPAPTSTATNTRSSTISVTAVGLSSQTSLANTQTSDSNGIALPTTTSQPASGHSPGAKIGIGIAIALSLVAIIALICGLIFWRRRRSTKNRHTKIYEADNSAMRHEVDNTAMKYELGNTGIMEMQDTGKHEMMGDGQPPVYEDYSSDIAKSRYYERRHRSQVFELPS